MGTPASESTETKLWRSSRGVQSAASSPDDAELSAAVADVEQRAGQARLRLRRLRGAQAAGFAAALGMGVDPDDLLTLGRSR